MDEGTIQDMVINKQACDSLFKPASWLSKIDYINHLILFNNVLITVLAEKNGGKTSFAALLQSNLDLQIQSCTINLQPSYDTQTLIDEICTGFAIDPQTDFPALVQQINEKKAQCLLLIDDAQFLDKSWIKDVLSSIKNQGPDGYFHLCFIADYSMVSSLNQIAGDFNNLIHTIELSGLNETETKTYIQYRARAENIPSFLLTDKLLGKIYQATAGDLAKIHANIGQYISDYMTPPSKSWIKSLRKTGVAGCIALAATGLAYINSHPGKPLGLEKNKALELKDKRVATMQAIAGISSEAVVMASQLPSWRLAATVKTVEQAKQTAMLSTQKEAMTKTGLTAQKHRPFYEQRTLPSVLYPFPGFSHPEVMTKRSKPVKKTLAVKPVDKKPFTIQLLASHKEETIKHFMQVNHLKKKSTIYTVLENNSQWFVLTLGEYHSLDAAKAVMSQLPSRLSQLKPWIRTTEGLKKQV